MTSHARSKHRPNKRPRPKPRLWWVDEDWQDRLALLYAALLWCDVAVPHG